MAPLNPQVKKLSGGKIEMTWTPDLSCFGYRFYRDGVAVAKGTKPEQAVTTFAAETDGQTHRYGIARALESAAESVNFPTVPPPVVGTLAYKPPGWSGGNVLDPASFPGFKVLTITQPGRYNLDDASSYYLKVDVDVKAPKTGGRVSVNLVGGKHIVCFGAKVSIEATTTDGDASDPSCFIFDDGDANGVIHVEGPLLRSTNAITVRTPRKIQVCYARAEVKSYLGQHGSAHSDVIQIWDRTQGKSRIYVDYLTSRSDYTGYSVLIDNPLSWEMQHVDHVGPQGPAVYYGDGKSCEWSSPGNTVFFKGAPNPVKLDDALAGWGGDNCRYEIHAGPALPGGVYVSPEIVTGGDCPPPLGTRPTDYITYAREVKLKNMRWIYGTPAQGDWVPASAVGAAYVPKGYA
jgi:hypothetical protein